MKKIKKWISSQRKRDANWLIQIILHSISIVAFLVVIDYFTKKPSINVRILTSRTGFYMNSVREFYKKHNFPILSIFNQYENLKVLFEDEKNKSDRIPIIGGMSDIRLVEAIKTGQSDTGFVKYRTPQLRRQLKNYSYKKLLYVYMDSEGFYDEEDFSELIDDIEPKLTPKEFFVFLCALIQSRKIPHTIWIKNDGDMDLKNIKLIIPSPLSKVYETREGNILDVSAQSFIPHDLQLNKENLILHLPTLKREELFSLRVITKENQISESDILSFYEEQNSVNVKNTLCIGIFVFVSMLLLRIFFKGKTKDLSE